MKDFQHPELQVVESLHICGTLAERSCSRPRVHSKEAALSGDVVHYLGFGQEGNYARKGGHDMRSFVCYLSFHIGSGRCSKLAVAFIAIAFLQGRKNNGCAVHKTLHVHVSRASAEQLQGLHTLEVQNARCEIFLILQFAWRLCCHH